MLSEYVPGQVVRLVKNPDYWKVDETGTQLPYLDGIDFLIVPGTDPQIAQFLAGNLDQLNISGAQFPDFKSRELAGADFRVVQSPALFGSPPHLALFDAADEDLARVFSDAAFRQAIEQAVDRQRVIDDVYNGLAEIPGTPTAPANGAFYEDTTDIMRPYDLEAAAAALDELGLTDTDGDGIRNITPERELEFTLTSATTRRPGPTSPPSSTTSPRSACAPTCRASSRASCSAPVSPEITRPSSWRSATSPTPSSANRWCNRAGALLLAPQRPARRAGRPTGSTP